jgi:parallel beta-helix repeat protein
LVWPESQDHLIINENIFTNNILYALRISKASNINIHNNTMKDNFYHGIYGFDLTDSTIVMNSFNNNRGGDIDLSDSTNNNISKNTILKDGGNAIELRDCSYFDILKNIIMDGSIILHCSDYCNVIENHISDNKNWSGIELICTYVDEDNDNNNISRNVIENCLFGILLLTGSYNIISSNNISNCNINGILLTCSNNKIIKNNISLNNIGLYSKHTVLSKSRNNEIFHNNFICNEQNVIDEGINDWYNKTLKEGNYWSDYRGFDLSPRDGIGDTPYSIPGGVNRDKYPLMKPYGEPRSKSVDPIFLRILEKQPLQRFISEWRSRL